MENEELRLMKREFNVKLDQLERKQLNFKRRICVLLNLFIPGLGFFIFGTSYIKGTISFILFYSYGVFYRFYIVPSTDIGVAVLYSIPAIVIWIASAACVGGLNE